MLTDKIKNLDWYLDKFKEWIATEIDLGENKFFYQLKDKDSQVEKVCLYVDGYFMCIYGDYGVYAFNQMTWKGNVYNLEYDNIGYQMEKLSHDSKDSIKVFDDSQCKEDILEWLKERLENSYELEDDDIEKVIIFLNSGYTFSLNAADEFCEENNLHDIKEIIKFSIELLEHIDEFEWISFLRKSDLCDFDEVCESDLWTAGQTIKQGYYISLLALKICGEKLKNRNLKEM